MTHRIAVLATVLWLSLAGLAAGQADRVDERLAAAAQEPRSTKIYEDVEILRRMLNRKLGELSPSAQWGNWRRNPGIGTAANTPMWDYLSPERPNNTWSRFF